MSAEVSPSAAPPPGWHAHVYYDPGAGREPAARLRAAIGDAFPDAVVGSWHDEPVGPHSQAMYQVAFSHDLFARLVPFLALHRDGLNILIHPDSTGDHLADHTEHAIWMGTPLPIRTEIFTKTASKNPRT